MNNLSFSGRNRIQIFEGDFVKAISGENEYVGTAEDFYGDSFTLHFPEECDKKPKRFYWKNVEVYPIAF